ncbi:MAG: class I adenylate-forming enzyme family protein [Halobacteriales archaeon]
MEHLDGRPLEHVGEITRMGGLRYPERRAVASAGGMGERSYGELDERSDRLAHLLRDVGVEPGDRVALYLPNTLEFPESYFAVTKAGGVVVPLNLMLDDRSIRYVVDDAGVDVVISTPLLAAGVDRDRVSVTAPQELFADTDVETLVADGLTSEGLDVVGYSSLEDQPEEPVLETSPDGLAVQMYTSGTTGKPKGVMLSHDNVLSGLESFTKTAPRIDPDDTVLVVLPLFHVYGLNILLGTYLYSGGEVVLMESPEPHAILSAIEEYEVRAFPTVPAILRMVLDVYDEDPSSHDLGSLEMVGSGAAPLSEDVKNRVVEDWGVVMGEGWAMTETAGGGTVLRQGSDLWKPSGCIGRPMYEMELKLVDDDREVVVPAEVLDARTPPPSEEYVGVEGEMAVRGQQVFEGYFGLPEVTDEVFDDEGWFYTGDVAGVDEDGDLWIQGRTDDMILVGGENVYPEQVENALNDHPDVEEAGVAGVPHEVKGEAPVAFVVARDGAGVSEEGLRRYALERVPSYAHPRRVFFVDEVPRSATRKVQRFKLRERGEEMLDGALESSERL